MVEQRQVTYSPLRKALKKQTKAIENQEKRKISHAMNQEERQLNLINNDKDN